MKISLDKFKDAAVNLIRKTYINLKSAKISQKIAGLIISTAMVFSFAGCEELPTPTPGTNPGGDPPTHEEQPGATDERYEGYSELVQNIMSNKRYDELVDQIFIDNMSIINSGEVEPHPYAFLEDEGYDVEAIKKGDDLAYTMSYVLDEEPNNLYMYTRVLNNDHYVNYLLKYELTDEEMDDYNLLHCPDGSAHFYLQSIFMNNEISKTRKPEIVGKTKIGVETFEKLTQSLQNTDSLTSTDSCDFILINPDKQSNTFEIIVLPRLYQDNYMSLHSFCSFVPSRGNILLKNDVFISPSSLHQIEAPTSTQKNATFYFAQDANIALNNAISLESKN